MGCYKWGKQADISQLVGEAWLKALTPEYLISGFLHSGIHRLSSEKKTAEKLAPSANTHHSGGKTIDEILAVPKPGKGETKKQQPPCHQIPVFSCVYLSWLAFFLLTFSLSLFFFLSRFPPFSLSFAVLLLSCPVLVASFPFKTLPQLYIFH